MSFKIVSEEVLEYRVIKMRNSGPGVGDVTPVQLLRFEFKKFVEPRWFRYVADRDFQQKWIERLDEKPEIEMEEMYEDWREGDKMTEQNAALPTTKALAETFDNSMLAECVDRVIEDEAA